MIDAAACRTVLVSGLALLALTGASAAAGPSDEYCARLSEEDHYNSEGEALSRAGAIVRQDRANFHERINRDDEDESDRSFRSSRRRALLERFVDNSDLSSRDRRRIVRGTPYICVTVEGDYVTLSVDD